MFLAKYPLIAELVEYGADPSIEFDGRLFFERVNDSLNDYNYIHGSGLITLHAKGFDLFSPAPKTQKSFLNYMKPETTFRFCCQKMEFKFPVCVITKGLLDAIFRNVPECLYLKVDVNDNTLLHYLYYTSNQRYVFCLLEISVSILNSIKSKSGKTPLQLIIEHEKSADSVNLIQNSDDLEIYLAIHVHAKEMNVDRFRMNQMISDLIYANSFS